MAFTKSKPQACALDQRAPGASRLDYRSISAMTAGHDPMTQLGHLDDVELARLAIGWRKTALRGDRESFGIAHALEVEQRRRLQLSQIAELLPAPALKRTWWRLWTFGFTVTANDRNPNIPV